MQHRPLMRAQLTASGSGAGRCCSPGSGTHVHLSHVYPCRLVDDAAHARLGRDIRAEAGMPVLLALLGAKDHRPLVVAQLEDLEQKAAKAVIRPAEQPFVEDEDLEGPVFPHGLRDPSRALLRILPGACLLGKRAGEIGLSRACRPKSTTSWPLVAGPQIASSPESTRSSLRSFA